MEKYQPSTIERYIFNSDTNGALKGGYPLKTFAEEEELQMKMLGGGLVESIGIEKFNDYVIPIGLFTGCDYSNMNMKKYNKDNKKIPGVIDDELFDKIFSNIRKGTNGSLKSTKSIKASAISIPLSKKKRTTKKLKTFDE